MKSKNLWAVTCLMVAMGGLARGDMIPFTGDSQASAFSNGSQIHNHLAFSGSGVNNLLAPENGGDTILAELGSFAISLCDTKNCSEDFGSAKTPTEFMLVLSLSSPTVNQTPLLIGANIFGAISANGSSGTYRGKVTIDFDNAVRHLSYGTGSFDFMVLDPDDLTDTALTAKLRASIFNVKGDATTAATPISSVPEPASLTLLATAAVLAGWGVRRCGLRDIGRQLQR